MPNHVPWDPDFQVGHAAIDAQHRALLDQCNLLADLCTAAPGEPAPQGFDAAFTRLKALVREHLDTESVLLATADPTAAEDMQDERDEFEYLAGEVATTENFDRFEVQRFVSVWCLGHVTGSAQQLRDVLASDTGPGQT